MRLLRSLFTWLALLFAARARSGRARLTRIVALPRPHPSAEAVVIALLFLAALCGAGFLVVYGVSGSTQGLGLTIGGSLGFIAIALIIMGKTFIPTEELEEEYSLPEPEAQQEVVQILRESGSGITRKRLLGAAGGAAAAGLGAAAIVPALSMGPLLDPSPLERTAWRRGKRLVDENNRPVSADDIEEGAYYTAYPQGERHNQLSAPIVLVRLPPSMLDLPPGRGDWAPEGIVAYSKICTHAGCAINLYRYPLFPEAQPKPALVCPCHYSTFDPGTGGTVEFGPAGRPLPQLPLMIDSRRILRAAGNFSERIGPSWSAVRRSPK
jgi:ubiquinol-cytochrome c reductase iron-sulfur subunit